MSSSTLGPNRLVAIPEDIREAIGANIGDVIEFVRQGENVLLRVRKGAEVDRAPGSLPPAPTYEERIRRLTELEGNAEDDSQDIPIEEIRSSRTRKTLHVTLDG